MTDLHPSFETLFRKKEIQEIQEIQDAFAHATGVAAIITDPMGTPITRPSNFTRLCRDLIRNTKAGRAKCTISDAALGNGSPDRPEIRPCLSCGLTDAGVRIHVAGRHIGNWLIGQVRTENTDPAEIRAYADRLGIDREAFESAFKKVPKMSMARFTQIANALHLMANHLCGSAYQRLELKFMVKEKDRAEQELKKQNAYMAALHETALGMFSRRKLATLLGAIIRRAVNLAGMSDGFILIYTPEENQLTVQAACGKYTDRIGVKMSPGEGVTGRVWETGEPVIINDYPNWTGRVSKEKAGFIASIIGVPMTSGSRIEGAMGLSHHEKGKTIQAETLPILEQFAKLATIAIDNAKLFESLKKELDQRIQLEKEQKKMEARLRQSHKMEAMGTLAGGIAHDFNNILSPIIGYAEMIKTDLGREGQAIEQLDHILTAAFRARDLVRQILTFSRQSEQERIPLQIRLILKEALELARATLPATIQIRADLPRGCGLVMADPTQIHQVAMNLMTNAMHAMEMEGGMLTVRLYEQAVSPGREPVHGMAPGVYVCLEVSDTGSGMDGPTLKRIFEPYFTDKPKGKGTGLGLAVVHGIVKNIGGEIQVRSQPGKGSSFFIFLPKLSNEKDPYPENPVKEEILPGKERILLVDDEPMVLKMLEQMLVRKGYGVTSESSSTRARALFENDPLAFDLLIADYTMPDLTGDKLILELKQIRPDLPVILCTGFSEKMVNGMTMAVKPDRIFMKPVTGQEFLTAVRSVLDSRWGQKSGG